MEIQQLIATAREGRYAPIHIIVGSERFFVDRAVAALRRAVVGDGVGWNEDIFQGKGLAATRVLEAARTLPMMAQARLVLVRNADQMANAELDKLVPYLDDAVDSACLVVLADKLDGRSKLMRAAKSKRVLTDASPLRSGALRGFLQEEARTRQLKLAADAAAALLDAVGNDLPALDDALERLSLYVGDSANIDLDAVEQCVSRVRTESIWALVDAVGQRNQRAALRATASLLADREPPLRILAMVARQLRMVARMADGLQGGLSAGEAAKAAGAPPFKAADLATAARRFGQEQLAQAFKVLAKTDLALKGSRRPPDLILQGAIVDLTR